MKPQYSQSLLFSLLCMMLFSGCDSYNPFQQYQEEHRPQYHFTTPTGWLGVPAGMVYFKGRYHIFYQQNGSEEKPGKMNWGHATSKDLVYWEHFSAALHDEEKSLLPGSVVVDWDNSSGFGSGTDPVMVAIYTASQNENQELHLAFSDDEGRSWERFEGNPVLDNNIHQLTDPNVFWHHESGKWVMVAATEREQKIQIYTSENLKEWERMDEYESGSELNGNWQNPGMFQLPVDGNSSNVKWVLHMSTGNGTSSGRAGTQYVIGDFNGERFNVDSEFKDEVRWMDSGPDFFAPKTFTNIPGSDNRRILMAWMNNGDYAEDISTKPWRNSLTLPREMMLKTIDEEVKLVQLPVVELRTLRTNRLRFRNRTITEESNFLRETGITGTSAALIAEFEPGNAEQFGFEIRRSENERTIIAYDNEREELFVDRTNSGNVDFDASTDGRYSAEMKLRNGRIKMRIFIDRSSVEVFGNDGEAVISAQIFPAPESNRMALYVKSGEAQLISLDVWQLQSIW